MITVLHRGGYAQMITILHRGGGTPKSDYVICARPLMGLIGLFRMLSGAPRFSIDILRGVFLLLQSTSI